MRTLQKAQNLYDDVRLKLKDDYRDEFYDEIRISNNMVKILQKYYQNEIEIIAEEIDAEYQIFIHAGDKPNYYKSDEEIKQVLPSMAEKIKQETNIIKVSRYADEYFTWSEHLQLDVSQLKNDYKTKISSMIYDKIINGSMEYLT